MTTCSLETRGSSLAPEEGGPGKASQQVPCVPRAYKLLWCPVRGFRLPQTLLKEHEGSHSPAYPSWCHWGPWEDVCMSSQVRAGCALQINSSFYTYSFCLCAQPARQRPGGAFSRRCLWCGFYRRFLFNQTEMREEHGKCLKCAGHCWLPGTP